MIFVLFCIAVFVIYKLIPKKSAIEKKADKDFIKRENEEMVRAIQYFLSSQTFCSKLTGKAYLIARDKLGRLALEQGKSLEISHDGHTMGVTIEKGVIINSYIR